jgi:hypothetical protein
MIRLFAGSLKDALEPLRKGRLLRVQHLISLMFSDLGVHRTLSLTG